MSSSPLLHNVLVTCELNGRRVLLCLNINPTTFNRDIANAVSVLSDSWKWSKSIRKCAEQRHFGIEEQRQFVSVLQTVSTQNKSIIKYYWKSVTFVSLLCSDWKSTGRKTVIMKNECTVGGSAMSFTGEKRVLSVYNTIQSVLPCTSL